MAELTEEETALVAEAWRRRRAAHPHGYLHAIVNEGRDAGASLAHSHSQLVWLDGVPRVVAAETGLDRVTPVEERNGLVAGCPSASRVPYEVLIAPVQPERNAFASALLVPALQLLREIVRRLHAVEGQIPYNAWLHDGEQWHLELFPRVGVLAGVELGAGIYINTLRPEDAAERLRAV